MTKTPINWIGSKNWISKRIIELMPPHKMYCEVFGGGASVLFKKPCPKGGYAEIYNDIDNDLVNFFRVVQKKPWKLIAHILFTPSCSKFIFNKIKTSGVNDVERAYAFYYRNIYSFGGRGEGTGFPRRSPRKAKSILNAIEEVYHAWERLEGVYIEQLDYKECIKRYDSKKVLFFIDPPYFKGTIKQKSGKVLESFPEYFKFLLQSI
jgi:DNA adenine methylase